MNKTLIKIGVAIWGLVLLLSFVIGFVLGVIGVDAETIAIASLPFVIIEIIAFVITAYGLLTGSD